MFVSFVFFVWIAPVTVFSLDICGRGFNCVWGEHGTHVNILSFWPEWNLLPCPRLLFSALQRYSLVPIIHTYCGLRKNQDKMDISTTTSALEGAAISWFFHLQDVVTDISL